MTLLTGRLTVKYEVPVLVVPAAASAGGYTITVCNLSDEASVYLGNSQTKPENGFELVKGSTLTIPVNAIEPLYAITAKDYKTEITFMASKR